MTKAAAIQNAVKKRHPKGVQFTSPPKENKVAGAMTASRRGGKRKT